MARRRAGADSLDLLLDTICNTFGGILFIAILVVILLQLHGDDPSATAATNLTPQEVERLQAELAGRETNLDQLRELLADQQHTLVALAPANLATLVDEHAAAVDANAKLMQQREQMLMEAADLTKSILQTQSDLRTANEDLVTAEQQLAGLQEQLETDRQARRRELRTPVQRPSSGTSEVGCVLQYGRFYVWHRYDKYGIRRGLNTDDFIVLEDTLEGMYTVPRPTGGIPLDGSEASSRQLQARLGDFRPQSTHITIVVRPDSFAEWSHLRNILVERGFEYRLMPTDTAIVDRGATDSRVQ